MKHLTLGLAVLALIAAPAYAQTSQGGAKIPAAPVTGKGTKAETVRTKPKVARSSKPMPARLAPSKKGKAHH